MIFLKSFGAGIATSIIAVIVYAVILFVIDAITYRGHSGMVGINIIGLLPLTIALLGFATGFYLVFKNST